MVIPADSEVVANGWPLGLGNMNIRLRLGGATPTEPYSSPSFSSLSSSNLDTESTASFFPDRSVSLGRLIGIRPGNRGPSLLVEKNVQSNNNNNNNRRSHSDGGKREAEGVCVPLLQNVMGKMSRSKSSTKLRMFHN